MKRVVYVHTPETENRLWAQRYMLLGNTKIPLVFVEGHMEGCPVQETMLYRTHALVRDLLNEEEPVPRIPLPSAYPAQIPYGAFYAGLSKTYLQHSNTKVIEKLFEEALEEHDNKVPFQALVNLMNVSQEVHPKGLADVVMANRIVAQLEDNETAIVFATQGKLRDELYFLDVKVINLWDKEMEAYYE